MNELDPISKLQQENQMLREQLKTLGTKIEALEGRCRSLGSELWENSSTITRLKRAVKALTELED